MIHVTLDLLACLFCHNQLEYSFVEPEVFQSGALRCAYCSRMYTIVQGISRFITPDALTGLNRRFTRMYDWFS